MNEYYKTWTDRFYSNKGQYHASIFNEETNKYELFLVSPECALAFLESEATDFDFLPSRVVITTKNYPNKDKWPSPRYSYKRYAYYENPPCGNVDDGRYIILFGGKVEKMIDGNPIEFSLYLI